MKRASTAQTEVQPSRVHTTRPPSRKLRAVARPGAPIAFMPELDKVQAILDENQRLKQEVSELQGLLDALRQLAWGTFS